MINNILMYALPLVTFIPAVVVLYKDYKRTRENPDLFYLFILTKHAIRHKRNQLVISLDGISNDNYVRFTKLLKANGIRFDLIVENSGGENLYVETKGIKKIKFFNPCIKSEMVVIKKQDPAVLAERLDMKKVSGDLGLFLFKKKPTYSNNLINVDFSSKKKK